MGGAKVFPRSNPHRRQTRVGVFGGDSTLGSMEVGRQHQYLLFDLQRLVVERANATRTPELSGGANYGRAGNSILWRLSLFHVEGVPRQRYLLDVLQPVNGPVA